MLPLSKRGWGVGAGLDPWLKLKAGQGEAIWKISKNSKEANFDQESDRLQDLEAKDSKDRCQKYRKRAKRKRIEELKFGEQWIKKVSQIVSSELRDLGTCFHIILHTAQGTDDDIVYCII